MFVKSYANKYYANEKFTSFKNFNPLFDHENDIEDTNMLKNRIEYYIINAT
ncbi:BBA14 family lipoprotein [Borreliella turdi]|uniref:BBA14 family lipoprotein n=1 Tax=Borreliella turdi TaxID=57863 RepID=UPI001F17D62E|nr:BBA14 family lipoprotein [Borreliella turdi]